jgi:hypothetical protein
MVVGMYALLGLAWAISTPAIPVASARRTLHLSVFAGVMASVFAFNLFAFSHLPGPHVLWLLLSLVAGGWFSFRIHDKFDTL